ncbi:MAG: hypothetical protein WCQ95_14595 [Bacteroidota bacterium]
MSAYNQGLFLFITREPNTQGYGRIPDEADAIELVWAVVEGKLKASTELDNNVRKECKTMDESMQRAYFYKARFQFQIPSIYTGFELYCWARYTISRHPELAGPWSECHIITIQ